MNTISFKYGVTKKIDYINTFFDDGEFSQSIL